MSYTKHDRIVSGAEIYASDIKDMDNKIYDHDSDISDLQDSVDVLEPTASSSDVGKALKVKTVAGGKATAYEFGETAIIDNTLTQTGQAADAKKTGDEITGLKSAFDSLAVPVIKQAIPWNQGWIRNDGSNGDSANTCRTLSMFALPANAKVTAKEGFKVQLFEYSVFGDLTSFVKKINANYESGTNVFATSDDKYYRFSVKNTEEARIYYYDLTDDTVTWEGFPSTDTTLTLSGKAGDAKATGDRLSALNNDFDNIIGKRNLLYNVGITQGKAINSSGVIETNSVYSCTDEIALQEGEYLLITQKSSTDGTVRVHGYKNGTWVKQIKYGTGTSYIFSVDSTVDAIRISYNHQSTILAALMLGTENVVQMIEMVQENVVQMIEMVQIESQLNSNGEYTFMQSDIINGGYNSDGSYATNNNQLRTEQIFTLTGDCSLLFIPGETVAKMRYAYKTKTGSSYSVSSWITSESLIHFDDAQEKIIILFRNSAEDAISPSEYDATTTLIRFSASSQDFCTIPVHLERGSYSSESNYYGDSNTFKNYVINQYPIKLNGATQIIFSGLPNEAISTHIYLYTSEGSRIRYDNYTITNGKVIPIKDQSCYYIDISFTAFDYWKYNVRLTAIKHGGAVAEEVKRIYKNSSNTIIKYFMVDEQEEIFTTMNYMLPPNYTNDGAKVPVILWFDGNTGYSNMGERFNPDKMPGLSYLRDEGYAIIQIFAWGSYFANKYPRCGLDQPYPIPTNLKMIKAGLDYFTSRYNVDAENIHVVSKSVGGMISLYFVSNPIYPFKSINMFAPVLDFISMRGRYSDAKKALAEELDLQGNLTDFYDANFQYFSENGETFWTMNKEKLLWLNSAWVNLVGSGFDSQFASSFTDARTWWANKSSTNVYANGGYAKIGCVPVKIWGSADDTETPYPIMPEIVKQLQNAGCTAEMRTIPNGWGGHSSADIAGTYNTIASITTTLGITHTNVPIGWAESIKWIRLNSMKK